MAWVLHMNTLFYVALFEGRNWADTQGGQINDLQLDDALLDAACAVPSLWS